MWITLYTIGKMTVFEPKNDDLGAFIFDLSDFFVFCYVENFMWITRETIANTEVAGVKHFYTYSMEDI